MTAAIKFRRVDAPVGAVFDSYAAIDSDNAVLNVCASLHLRRPVRLHMSNELGSASITLAAAEARALAVELLAAAAALEGGAA